jgi:CheY-like chemotaxis protein
MPTTSFQLPVLLVDDSEDDIYYVRRLLNNAGVDNPVISFTDSADAFAFLRTLVECPESPPTKPGVMFLDIKMPKIHGFVLLKWVRRQAALDSMKIAVLSGSDEPEDHVRAEKLGAEYYLVKFPPASVFADVVTSSCALAV